MTATVVWITVFIFALAFEAYTIWWDNKPNTTLSSHVWRLRAVPFVRALLVASFAWLVYHFFYEDALASQTSVDDIALVVTAILATFVRTDSRLHVR